jgi:tripartite-type tricarboxylate transporter receptor subunit TctC
VGLPILTFFAPIGTPAPQLDALQAALQFAQTNKGVEKQYSTIGLTPGFYSGSVTKAKYVAAYNAAAQDASVIEGT